MKKRMQKNEVAGMTETGLRTKKSMVFEKNNVRSIDC